MPNTNIEDRYNPLDGLDTKSKSNSLKHSLSRFACDIKNTINLLAVFLSFYLAITYAIGCCDHVAHLTGKRTFNIYMHSVVCVVGVLIFFSLGISIYIGSNICGRVVSMQMKNHFHAIIMSLGMFCFVIGKYTVDPWMILPSEEDRNTHGDKADLAFDLLLISFLSGIIAALIDCLQNSNAFIRITIKLFHGIVGLAAHISLMLLAPKKKYLIFYFAIFGTVRLLYLLFLDYKVLRKLF